MSNATLETLVTRHGVDVLEHLDRQVSVPVVDGLQTQGDVIIIPWQMNGDVWIEPTTPVPAEGVAVVRGENGGNTHLLLAEGQVTFETRHAGPTGLNLGALTVCEGAVAYLAHPEHGYTGIAPGDYVIRRQREQADEIRLVQD